MGAQLPGSGGSSRRGTPTTIAEINVTPLVDVMLVLLIVFMISAPLMTQGVQVDLPKAKAQTLSDSPHQLMLVIKQNGSVLLSDKLVETRTLSEKLTAIADAQPNVEIFIQADRSVPYGVVAQVMAEVKRSKISRVGLVTDPGESP
jgi:biopolymer transport protein TolR